MPYTQQSWEDEPSTDTPINAERLNHIEDGIDDAHDAIDGHLIDAGDAHDASAISFTPGGSIAATNVQDAILEAAAEGGGGGSAHTIKENGSALPARAGLNFVDGLTASDDSGSNETDVNVAFGSVTAETTFGASSADGTAVTVAHSDHTHGTPTNPVTAHEAAADPHAGYVLESLFDANSILKADTDNTPEALSVAEQRIVGRITGGEVTALTATQVRTLLSLADEQIQDIVGAMVTGNTETGIAVTYDDTNARLDFVVEVPQTEFDAHLTDSSDAHDASAVSYAGAAGLSATDVEAALDELDLEKLRSLDLGLYLASEHDIDPDGNNQQTDLSALFTLLATGGVVVFNEAGTYRLAGGGDPASATEIRGLSRHLSTLKATVGSVLAVLNPIGKTGITVRDLLVDGLFDVNGGSNSAVRFDDSIDNWALFGRSHNTGGYGVGYQGGGAQQALVLGWHFTDIGTDCIDFKNDDGLNWGNTVFAVTADGWALNNGGTTKAMLDARGPVLSGLLWGRNPDATWGVGARFHIDDIGGNGPGGHESTLFAFHFEGGLYAIQNLARHVTTLGGTGTGNATTLYIGTESENAVHIGFHSIDATDDGVIVVGDYAQLASFVIDNPAGDGIQINSTATGTRIPSGRVTSAGGYGIRDAGQGTIIDFDMVDLTGNTSGEYLADFTGQSNRDALGDPWVEGADILVNQDQLAIRSGAVARDLHGSGTGSAFRDTRFRGNVSVKVLWDGTDTGEGGPMLHLNPADPFLGVGMVWNSFLSSWSLRYVGQTPSTDAQLLDTTPATRSSGTDATVELRSVGGKVAGYVDGTLVCGPITIASTLAGSKLHGMMVTDTSLTGTAVDVASIKTWAVDSYATALPTSRVSASVQGAATTAKTTGASNTLSLAYPSGIQVGELLVLVVVSQKTGGIGSTPGFTHPSSAYRSGTADVTGAQAWAYRIADGSESGSVTVTKAGTAGEMGAMMFRVTAPNTTTPLQFPAFSNNASSTTIDAPAQTIVGPWRLGLWAGSALANQAITPPASWTEIAELGTSGATLNLSVAYRDWNTVHTAPFGSGGETTGEQDGTIASAAANVGGHTFINPS